MLEAEVMVKKVRVKRGSLYKTRDERSTREGFSDPLFDKQWHLVSLSPEPTAYGEY